VKIYLATWLVEKSQGDSLTEVGKRERLLSYFHIFSSGDEGKLMEYVELGKNRGDEI